MATITVPKVTALQAQAEANGFLLNNLPDRITADQPHLDAEAQVWRVPVILTYPLLGVLGTVGEIVVSANEEKIVSFTPIEEILAAARTLAEQHRDAIEAPLP
jgi:hypothetical protein